MKTRTVIYDFDGTIFRSPEREDGENIYFEATGELLPFPGWWGRIESLTPPIVPSLPDENWYLSDTISCCKEDYSRQDTEVILMTGRHKHVIHRVFELCEIADLKFDRYFYKGLKGQKGTETFVVKRHYIQDFIIHPNLKILEIWEDRPEHVSNFANISKYWKSNIYKHLEQIIIHDVKTGKKLKI